MEYRTSLPISDESVRAFASHVTALHTESGSAETSFDVRNELDEIFVGVAKVESGRDASKICLSNPIQILEPPVDEKTRALTIRAAIRRVFESANDVLKGKVQPSLIYETQKKEE